MSATGFVVPNIKVLSLKTLTIKLSRSVKSPACAFWRKPVTHCNYFRIVLFNLNFQTGNIYSLPRKFYLKTASMGNILKTHYSGNMYTDPHCGSKDFPQFKNLRLIIFFSANRLGRHHSISSRVNLSIPNLTQVSSGFSEIYFKNNVGQINKRIGCCCFNTKNVAESLICTRLIGTSSVIYRTFVILDAIHSNPGYVGIMAPRMTNVRYITEDVPMSLVPIAGFGHVFGVKTAATDALIDLANVIFKIDFRKTGRNLVRLGMDKLTLDEIRNVFIDGSPKRK